MDLARIGLLGLSTACTWGALVLSPVAIAAVDDDGDTYGDDVDCDDHDGTVFPGATEVLDDRIDQDCDGGDTCYADEDNDGARGAGSTPSTDLDCADPYEGSTSDALDCADRNPSIRPGATEQPGTGVDQDCNGEELCYADADGDGARGTATHASADLTCSGPNLAAAAAARDCDDADDAAHPGADEVTGDGVDQDCDGTEVCLVDADDDGARTDEVVDSTDADCTDAGEALTSDALDCDDADPAVYGGADEVPDDGIDEDCDGGERCYVDADGDHHRGDDGATVASDDLDCDDAGEVHATLPADDCDDDDADVHPGATDVAGDGIDQDCTDADATVPVDDTDVDTADTADTDTDADKQGCGCATSGPGAPALAALAGLLAVTRRRRR